MEQEKFELLEDYLNKKLDTERRDQVDKLLEEDTQLAKELDEVRNAMEIVKQRAILDKLDEIHDQYLAKRNKRIIKIPAWIYATAASVIFILSYLWIMDLESPNSENLFAQYFEVYPDYVSERGRPVEASWEKAFQAYNEENFELAAQLLAHGGPHERMEDIRFYHALSLLSSEKPSDAIPMFQELLIEQSKYEQQVRWYLSLSFIIEKEFMAAKKVLQEIDEDEYNYSHAQEVLKEIE